MRLRVTILAALALAGAVGGAVTVRADAGPSEALARGHGLVPLPCGGHEPLRPADPIFCRLERNYVTPKARDALIRAARTLAARHPGTVLLYMDASWPKGTRPMPPHFSHGDGREADLALFYTDRFGAPLQAPPKGTRYGYGAYEPPRPGDPLPCKGLKRPGDSGDPPMTRPWRLDERKTTELLRLLIADDRVQRVLVEPHLEKRLGLWGQPKVRFEGCRAARHDDHLHVDFR